MFELVVHPNIHENTESVYIKECLDNMYSDMHFSACCVICLHDRSIDGISRVKKLSPFNKHMTL